ncbi:hypothetical protein JCGZ_01557 [Jatropha curcas]|uniref:Lysosomal Pro-X carboxypeptidase n=1 Tax=Jatropha curcas TaxID=180498 RepID=A0A067L9F9_JATCU|nr:hypothetical protein JCGZ_01557 [Jatropha curcas]
MDNDIDVAGILTDNADRFGALVVFIEHRFYGESVPFVSREEALRNATLRGYFSSAQALADYAEIILYIKKELSADKSPVIVFGGSYGGMLATWFRLKYPHIALGALASSAPILYFDGLIPQDSYFAVASKDFWETSESCYNTIVQSWAEIDRFAAMENGLSLLSKKFKTCKNLENVYELKEILVTTYAASAQYDKPSNHVSRVCEAITSAPQGTDILDKIFLGFVAFAGKKDCYDPNTLFWSQETTEGWNWQVCSDLVIPMGIDSNRTMFQHDPFVMEIFTESCKESYGVLPRPHWVTTYYGGQHIKEVLRRFGSNIIFSNGLRDPYSSGGVLEDISDSIVALTTREGSHCMDILYATKDDPEWLVLQRNTALEIISGWILTYYQDLFGIN